VKLEIQNLPNDWQKLAKANKKQHLRTLEKSNNRKVFAALPQLHDAVFEKVDCLTCAGCCKNYSPRFKVPDIKRISKVLKMKESTFIDTYLNLDKDGDYVLKRQPCTFLGADNMCTIYEDRPSDCRRFPYTDEDVFVKRTQISLKNIEFCPAAYLVVEQLQTLVPR
jgi:uncharacterized protein